MLKLIYVKTVISIFVFQTITISALDLKIIGGRYAENGEFPYQVSIRRAYSNMHNCGGAVITSKHILTAAHCCFYFWGGRLPPSVVKVVAGELALSSTSAAVSSIASKIIVHPDYDPNTFANDIALIELQDELPSDNDLVAKIPINDNIVANNTLCVISGWGVQNYPSYILSSKLMTTEVFILDHAECLKRYKVIDVQLSNGMLCTVNEKKEADACQGDSGGPLVCEGKLTGIISTGKECANKSFPGIYSDVYYFREWVRENVGNYCLVNDTGNLTLQSTSSENDILPTIVEPTTFANEGTYVSISFHFAADGMFNVTENFELLNTTETEATKTNISFLKSSSIKININLTVCICIILYTVVN